MKMINRTQANSRGFSAFFNMILYDKPDLKASYLRQLILWMVWTVNLTGRLKVNSIKMPRALWKSRKFCRTHMRVELKGFTYIRFFWGTVLGTLLSIPCVRAGLREYAATAFLDFRRCPGFVDKPTRSNICRCSSDSNDLTKLYFYKLYFGTTVYRINVRFHRVSWRAMHFISRVRTPCINMDEQVKIGRPRNLHSELRWLHSKNDARTDLIRQARFRMQS